MNLSHNLSDYEIRVTGYAEDLFGADTKFHAEAFLNSEQVVMVSGFGATEQDAIERCVRWIGHEISKDIERHRRNEIRKNPVSVKVVRAA